MATATASTSPAITELDRLGFKYDEVAQFDLEQLSPERRVQVRETDHYARKEDVERYAVMMAHSEFPSIIITRDNWIVDGNTRIGASLQRGQKFFPALVLDISYQQAGAKRRDELHALAATLNAMNGTALTPKERRAVSERLIALGWKTEQISRALGVKANTVTAVKKELEAVTRLRAVGIDPNGKLKGASLRGLGEKRVLALNDEPYRELASLVDDAGLTATELKSFAKEAKETGSDQAALERLSNLRTEMMERIRQKELTGSGKPPVSRQLRQHLGFVVRFEGEESTLVETNPDVVAQHRTQIETSIKVLEAVLVAQGG